LLIHELVGHALEADTVRRGDSYLARRRTSVAPSDVRVVDDPGRGRGGWRIDDEGQDAVATDLLWEGRVHGYLYDQGMAALDHARSNGHGRRAAFRDSVHPRMGCTFLEAGDAEPAEAVASVREGIYVRRMEAGSVDPRSGDAVFHVTDADRILDGRIDAPVRPFCLMVHSSIALPTLTHVARDLAFDTCVGSCLRDGQALPTSVGAPTFRIGMGKVIAAQRERSHSR
jgi:TldD protein